MLHYLDGLSTPMSKRIDPIEQFLNDHPTVAEGLKLRTTPFIPHVPTSRQRLFLSLPHKEAFFGGAAGGGKSDALLMGALQYVDIPKYSAIIFRKQLTDLSLPGALIPRSQEWLNGTPAEYKGGQWIFPSGATITFGYLSGPLDRYKYQGAEFQYIAFDELTQLTEEDYLYLRSRLRSPRCPDHANTPDYRRCKVCREYFPISRVPLRVRSASNPGGTGHQWVRERFNIRRHPTLRTRTGRFLYVGSNPKRPHIPSFLWDNPFLDEAQYADSLSELDPITREQLLSGDWGVTADGRFRKAWLRTYLVKDELIQLGGHDSHRVYHLKDCAKFQIIDLAASTREGPGDNTRYRKMPSYTVVMTFLLTPDNHLVIWDVDRFREEAPETYQRIKRAYAKHKPMFLGMEFTTMSTHFYQMLQRAGFNMRAFSPQSQDKISRSVDAQNRMEQGRIWFPAEDLPWVDDLYSELFTWTGSPEETADQIDCLSYGAIYVSEQAAYSAGEEAVEASVNALLESPTIVM